MHILTRIFKSTEISQGRQHFRPERTKILL